MGGRTLYLFVTSERPDQYLNPILHGIDKEGISNIVLVDIVGFGKPRTSNDSIASRVLTNVQLLWDSIASTGEYRYFSGDKSGQRAPIESNAKTLKKTKELYLRLSRKKFDWATKDIDYLKLREELNAFVAKDPSCILDVTALDKSLIGDIIAISVVGKIKNVFTFDLKIRPNFDTPWVMLYHNLQEKRRIGKSEQFAPYEYVNIIRTPVFQQCEKQILHFTFAFKLSVIIALVLFAGVSGICLALGTQSIFITIFGILASIVGMWSAVFPFTTRKPK